MRALPIKVLLNFLEYAFLILKGLLIYAILPTKHNYHVKLELIT